MLATLLVLRGIDAPTVGEADPFGAGDGSSPLRCRAAPGNPPNRDLYVLLAVASVKPNFGCC
jgi:hypothetical protein